MVIRKMNPRKNEPFCLQNALSLAHWFFKTILTGKFSKDFLLILCLFRTKLIS